jgi:hypothetical protein
VTERIKSKLLLAEKYYFIDGWSSSVAYKKAGLTKGELCLLELCGDPEFLKLKENVKNNFSKRIRFRGNNWNIK